MAQTKKTIPCRICGKNFEPCAYCQSHNDTFRWRNFACSIECAQKYIADTEAYRNSRNTKQYSETAIRTDLSKKSVIDDTVKTDSAKTSADFKKKQRYNKGMEIPNNETKETE